MQTALYDADKQAHEEAIRNGGVSLLVLDIIFNAHNTLLYFS